MFCRTIPGLSQTNLEFHPWRQQPQLILIPDQLSLLNPAHIHLMTQLNWRQPQPPQVLCCVNHPALPNLLLLLLTDYQLTSLLVLSSRDTQFETYDHLLLFCFDYKRVILLLCTTNLQGRRYSDRDVLYRLFSFWNDSISPPGVQRLCVLPWLILIQSALWDVPSRVCSVFELF